MPRSHQGPLFHSHAPGFAGSAPVSRVPPHCAPSRDTLGSPRAVVVDDHPLFRRGLRDAMERGGGFSVVGEAGSGREALVLIRSLQPDLVLLDMRLGDMDAADALSRLHADRAETRVAVVTASRDPVDMQSALRAGADGYLLKTVEPQVLLAQLRRVLAGELVLADGLGESLARAIRDDRQCGALDRAGLTDRERQILECIADGYGNQRIAVELGIAESTVKVHVKHLLRKLGVRSRVEAALWCLNQARRAGRSGPSTGSRGFRRVQMVEAAQCRMPEDEERGKAQ